MSQGILRRFYNSSQWQKVRRLRLEIDYQLCQWCLKEGKITTANVVHHLHEITPENLDEYGLNLDNLVSLCRICHEKHHSRLQDDECDYDFTVDGDLIYHPPYEFESLAAVIPQDSSVNPELCSYTRGWK